MERTDAFHLAVLSYGGKDGRAIASRQRTTPSSAAEKLARECHAKVIKIRDFLGEVMASYADFENGMHDSERDKVDTLVSEALGEAEKAIRDLEQSSAQEAENMDVRDHRKGVAMLLLEAVRGVQETANGARSLRQRHVLSSRDKLCAFVTTEERITIVDDNVVQELSTLDEQEMMLLEAENEKLEKHLSTVLEEARRIEQNALEVSALLATFSEEVLNQHHVIGSIYDDAQKNVDIVNRVPAQLAQAAEHGKGFRRFMLIFLLASGLLLLLLDWMDS